MDLEKGWLDGLFSFTCLSVPTVSFYKHILALFLQRCHTASSTVLRLHLLDVNTNAYLL